MLTNDGAPLVLQLSGIISLFCLVDVKTEESVLLNKRIYYNISDYVEFRSISNVVRLPFGSGLLVDLESLFYISEVVLVVIDNKGQMVGGNKTSVSVGGVSPRRNESLRCAPSESSAQGYRAFECKRVSRFLMLDSDRDDLLLTAHAGGYEVFLENLIGCFRGLLKTFVTSSFMHSVVQCRISGRPFLAIKANQHFVCLRRLTKLPPVRISDCRTLCNERHICGQDDLYAVYQFDADRRMDFIEPSCVLSDKFCHHCRPGFAGISCRIRDCSVNNGHCGMNKCIYMNFRQYQHAICACEKSSTCPDLCTASNPCRHTIDHRCILIGRNHRCVCYEGFQEEGDGRCADVDECLRSDHDCHLSVSRCVNIVGSYLCECFAGLRKEGHHVCKDIDECRDYSICPLDASRCTNTFASFKCHCAEGLHWTGTACEDVDECQVPGICDSRTTVCENTIGSHLCLCRWGYYDVLSYEDTSECRDIDECKRKSKCDPASTTCRNTIGSYYCPCLPGFRRSNYYKCFDSCTKRPCKDLENSECVPIGQLYRCDCRSGFSMGQDETCEDIDECQEKQICSSNKTCANSPGTFECQCPPGYEGLHCHDMDECRQHWTCQGDTPVCINEVGSFRCVCIAGFEKKEEEDECSDIDECQQSTDSCNRSVSVCVNNRGGYRCRCLDGFRSESDHECVSISIGRSTAEVLEEEVYDTELSASVVISMIPVCLVLAALALLVSVAIKRRRSPLLNEEAPQQESQGS